jgi:hypothetical protein
MRILQNFGLYRSYIPRLRQLSQGVTTFSALRQAFLRDRFAAVHILEPVLRDADSTFLTNGDDEVLQRAWASEMGMATTCTLEEILLAQLEAHRAAVFYNMDPLRYGNEFVRKLPGCVKHSITWRAAPSGNIDLSAYNLVVSNFPAILQDFAQHGCRTAYFFPGHDPAMDEYAHNTERPVDVLFAGSYSRHHLRRARLLEAVARLAGTCRVEMHLDESRATRLAESTLGRLLPLSRYRRPEAIRKVAQPPVFGRTLYEALSHSKIVVNGAIDMAGAERGNMRCWEAMGLGSLMLSDSGVYPAGMVAGESFITYESDADVPELIRRALDEWERHRDIARRGYAVVSEVYSKQAQMKAFEAMVAALQ